MVRLEVFDLKVELGKRFLLDVPNFNLKRGEIVCISGQNGAGKTTFLLSLLGLVRKKTGKIVFDGKVVGKQIKLLDFRRNSSISFKEPLLFNTTVYENITSGLKIRGLSKTEIERIVEEYSKALDVENLLWAYARSLSDGEAKRVSLLRAFVVRPKILLLDEPFSSLDSSFKVRVEALIKDTRDKYQTSIIVTSNNDSDIPEVSDRVCFMHLGRIVGEERSPLKNRSFLNFASKGIG